MNQEMAAKMVAAALTKAKADYGRPIVVAICDEYGFLCALSRMDGAPVRSIQIAQGKAYTASRIGTDTSAFQERLRRENISAGDFCDDKLTALPGGCAIKDGAGKLVGAIGISGLAPHEDVEIAKAAAALV